MAVILSIFAISFISAKDGEFTKKYNKEYEVRKGTQLQIEHKYGSIDIKNWDKSLISIEVVITVKTSNEDKARKLYTDEQKKEYYSYIQLAKQFNQKKS